MSTKYRRKFAANQRRWGCRGWNFHVFALCASKCSICGAPRPVLPVGDEKENDQ